MATMILIERNDVKTIADIYRARQMNLAKLAAKKELVSMSTAIDAATAKGNYELSYRLSGSITKLKGEYYDAAMAIINADIEAAGYTATEELKNGVLSGFKFGWGEAEEEEPEVPGEDPVVPGEDPVDPGEGGEGTDPTEGGEGTDPTEGGNDNPTDPAEGGDDPVNPNEGGENPDEGGENPITPEPATETIVYVPVEKINNGVLEAEDFDPEGPYYEQVLDLLTSPEFTYNSVYYKNDANDATEEYKVCGSAPDWFDGKAYYMRLVITV